MQPVGLEPFCFGVGEAVIVSGMGGKIIAAGHNAHGVAIYVVEETDGGFMDIFTTNEIARDRLPRHGVVDLRAVPFVFNAPQTVGFNDAPRSLAQRVRDRMNRMVALVRRH